MRQAGKAREESKTPEGWGWAKWIRIEDRSEERKTETSKLLGDMRERERERQREAKKKSSVTYQ